MVEPAADPAAGDDPRGVEHPQPGDEHEHPPRARRRPQRPPRLPRQVLLCHRETAAAGSEDQHKVQRHNQVMFFIPTKIQIYASLVFLDCLSAPSSTSTCPHR